MWPSDRIDLEKQFYTIQDGINGFTCMKVVHGNDVLDVCQYDAYAFYNGIKCRIKGPHKTKNVYFLETYEWFNLSKDTDLLRKVKEYGFERCDDIGHGIFTFGKYVSPEDPDLQIFEERTEIDVNSL